jgi:large subunit ribosomal protein L23
MALFNKNKNDEGTAKTAAPVVKKAEPAKESMQDLYKDETAAKVAKTGKADKKLVSQAYRILVKPLITEKAANLGAHNKYVFMVAPEANKISVAVAITEVYGIKPESVNILKVKGKKIARGKVSGRRKNWKKAIVTLPKGKSIKIYEGV